MKLYIIRHGQTEWNLAGRLQGWQNSNLTEEGIKNAERLSDRLKDIHFDYIYSSPQKRAIDTARIIKGKRNIDIITLEGLREIGFGVWEGMKIKDINLKYSEQFDTYLNRPHLYNPINGETFEELFSRVQDSLDRIISQGGDNILIVAHGVTIKAMTSMIKRIPLDEFSTIPVHLGTALNICEIKEGIMKFIVEGDISHIL